MGLPIVLAALALGGLALYLWRRPLLANILKLPPPRNGVSVQRDIAIPMPDGVQLYADHYAPKTTGAHPTILIRTPYGRRKELFLGGGMVMNELPGQRFAERGYHVLVQSVRGRYASEGDFDPHVNEMSDGQATVEWLSRQPWFNGELATWGPSYLGYTQWAVAASAPVSLKAMLPTVTSAENFSVTHPDGAFGLETRLRWSQGLANTDAKAERRTPRGAERRLQTAFERLPLQEADVVAAGTPIAFYREMLAHEHNRDAYWMERDHSGRVAATTAAVHLIGGWYDYYLRGLLRDYTALQVAGREPYLTIGPWHHAHIGGMLAGLREGITWFDAHLGGDRAGLREKPVRIFVSGAEEWREMDAFPPSATETRFYLHSQGGLDTDSPTQDSAPDHFRYDPADPTPALGGAILGMKGAGPQDNRPLAARADVLSYSSKPLAQALEFIGPVRMVLFVRSSLAHTDFFARLCDVHPDGRAINICDGLFRVQPGLGETLADGSRRIEIVMWAAAHRFRQGHRLCLLIASGAHPRWNRNLGAGEPESMATTMAVADQTIFHDSDHPSALHLPTLSA